MWAVASSESLPTKSWVIARWRNVQVTDLYLRIFSLQFGNEEPKSIVRKNQSAPEASKHGLVSISWETKCKYK
jgi:hypothetical protein